MAGEAGEQRHVLARVVGARVRRVDAVVGGEDEQVALRVEPRQPLPHGRVDLAQRAVEALDVVAVAEDLVGLDEVGEHEARRRARRSARRWPPIAAALVEPLCCSSTPTPLNTWPILPTVCTGTPAAWSSSQVGAARRVEREVAAPLGALERARLAPERPRDHAADGVLAGHDLARRGARRVQLGGRHTSSWAAICSTESADV